jgi:hypothetical protein
MSDTRYAAFARSAFVVTSLCVKTHLMNSARRAGDKLTAMDIETLGMANGFNLVIVGNDEDSYYERKVVFDGGSVSICLLDEPNAFSQSLPHAIALIESESDFLAAFNKLKMEQMRQFPQFAVEINILRLDSISFWSKKEPNAAEVLLKGNNSFRLYSCAYKARKFYNFSFE